MALGTTATMAKDGGQSLETWPRVMQMNWVPIYVLF